MQSVQLDGNSIAQGVKQDVANIRPGLARHLEDGTLGNLVAEVGDLGPKATLDQVNAIRSDVLTHARNPNTPPAEAAAARNYWAAACLTGLSKASKTQPHRRQRFHHLRPTPAVVPISVREGAHRISSSYTAHRAQLQRRPHHPSHRNRYGMTMWQRGEQQPPMRMPQAIPRLMPRPRITDGATRRQIPPPSRANSSTLNTNSPRRCYSAKRADIPLGGRSGHLAKPGSRSASCRCP